jgi:hypothetical protein
VVVGASVGEMDVGSAVGDVVGASVRHWQQAPHCGP